MKDKPAGCSERLAKAKEYALKYISYRPRTAWEVGRKLSDKGYNQEIIALVMAFLREYSFVDDEQFTRMWIRSRTREKPCGLLRIRAELIRKGVDRELVERCLADMPSGREEELAAALVEKKCLRMGFNYNKLKGFLLRRGFNPVTVNRVLGRYAKKFSD